MLNTTCLLVNTWREKVGECNMKWRAVFLSFILILGVLTGALHFGSEKAKGTYVCGIISTDTTWDLAGSPYIVIGDIIIEWSVTLTIEPGVQVLFDGYYRIMGDGTLWAVGTPTQRIAFSSNNLVPNPVYWYGIDVGGLWNAGLRYSDINYAHYGLHGDSVGLFEPAYNNISNNIFGISLRCGGNPWLHISSNYISFNDYGVHLSDCNAYPHAVTISDNNLVSNDYGVKLEGSDIIVTWNNFISNGVQAEDRWKNHFWWQIDAGNYWSDYDEEIEGCFDVSYPLGICDEPYHTIDLTEIFDLYPRTSPFSLPIPPDTSGPIIRDIRPPDGSVTNNTTPTIMANYSDISGVNASNALLKIDNIDVTSLADFTERNFSYTPQSEFSDGSHIVHLRIRDIVGNLAQKTWSFSIDTTSPSIMNLEPTNNSIVRVNTLEIGANYSDKSEINAGSVLLKVDDIDVTALASVTSTGVNLTISLVEGFHKVALRIEDIVGNPETANWSFIINTTTPDTFPPDIINLQPANSSVISDKSPNISANYSDLSGIDLNSIVLKIDNTDVTSGSIIAKNGITYTPSALLDGNHQVSLKVRDLLGNTALETWSFTIDTTGPNIENLKPADLSALNDNSPNIGANYSDSLGIDMNSILLKVDDIDVTSSAMTTTQGITYKPSTPISEGIHQVSLEVGDSLGNLALAQWAFTIDTTPPNIANLKPVDNSIVAPETTLIKADYSDSSGINVSSVLVRVDDIGVTALASVTSIGVELIMSLSNGLHTVSIEVADLPGNLAKMNWSFAIDTIPPTITNLQPANSYVTVNNLPVISSNYTDSSGIDTNCIMLKVDDIHVTMLATITLDGISYVPNNELSLGIHEVYLEVRDILGNIAFVTWQFTIKPKIITDTTPPIIYNLQPAKDGTTGDHTPLMGVNYHDSSGIDIRSIAMLVDGENVNDNATIMMDIARYQPLMPLSEGFHTIYLEVRDVYGNLAAELWQFVIDTEPPEILLTYLKPDIDSTIDDDMPMIMVAYTDLSGINTRSVILMIDGQDVTASALVTQNAVTYKMTRPLEEGFHLAYMEVADNNGNLVGFSWSFKTITDKEKDSRELKNQEVYQWSIVGVGLIAIFLLFLLVATGKFGPKKP
jgi:hypothetical protein